MCARRRVRGRPASRKQQWNKEFVAQHGGAHAPPKLSVARHEVRPSDSLSQRNRRGSRSRSTGLPCAGRRTGPPPTAPRPRFCGAGRPRPGAWKRRAVRSPRPTADEDVTGSPGHRLRPRSSPPSHHLVSRPSGHHRNASWIIADPNEGQLFLLFSGRHRTKPPSGSWDQALPVRIASHRTRESRPAARSRLPLSRIISNSGAADRSSRVRRIAVHVGAILMFPGPADTAVPAFCTSTWRLFLSPEEVSNHLPGLSLNTTLQL